SARARRAAEFDALFAAAVRGVDRVEPTRLRLELRPGRRVAGQAAELMVAETGCCSFFAFALTAIDGRLALEAVVPPAQIAVLDALADHAVSAAGLSA
ncbi:MAG TPA: hypothetical protein VMV07_14175, partial [Streptosporangiaceae bacterium]|nr:hypothetical protein [Streptosporangiaceae bacterium]